MILPSPNVGWYWLQASGDPAKDIDTMLDAILDWTEPFYCEFISLFHCFTVSSVWLTSDTKMISSEEEEERAESPVCSCVSDWSRDEPPAFSNEPGRSDTQ